MLDCHGEMTLCVPQSRKLRYPQSPPLPIVHPPLLPQGLIDEGEEVGRQRLHLGLHAFIIVFSSFSRCVEFEEYSMVGRISQASFLEADRQGKQLFSNDDNKPLTHHLQQDAHTNGVYQIP